MLAVAGASLAVPALAQTMPPPAAAAPYSTGAQTTNTPATDAIGPRELQNFSLPGTATRPPATTEQPAPATNAPPAQSSPAEVAPARVRRIAENRQPPRQTATQSSASKSTPVAQAPAPQLVAPSPQRAGPQPAPESAASEPPPITLAPESDHRLTILPRLIAALVLAGGIGFLLWRRRPREALAGAGEIDLFAVPEPEPAPPAVRWMPPPAAEQPEPAPAPVPRWMPPPATTEPQTFEPAAKRGIVASRLRPSLEIGVRPLRCLVEDSQVTLEFELDLFNAGTAPARAVLAEASLLNASATQEQDLAAFFSRPAHEGERLDASPPMKRMTMTSQVVAPRAAIQEYDLGGRKAFVPVMAFNALYEWSGGKGQTTAAYLVGRDTNGEKLAPLRLETGRREVRGLAARPLPTGVRS